MDKLFFDAICRADIDSRALPYVNLADDSDEEAAGEEATTETPEGEIQVKTAEKGRKAKKAKKVPTLAAPSANPDFQTLQEAINKIAENMEEGFAAMNTKVNDLAMWVQDVSARVKAIEEDDLMDLNDLGTGFDKTEEEIEEENEEEEGKEEGEETEEEEQLEEENVEEDKVEEDKVEEDKVEEDKVEEDKVEEDKVEEDKVELDNVEEEREKRNRKDSHYLRTPYRRMRKRTKKN